VRLSLAEHYADLLTAADQRRGTAPLRAIVGYLIAAILYFRFGWAWAWAWATVYAASQMLEIWALRPAVIEAWARPRFWRGMAILAVFMTPAALYAPLAIPVWSNAQYGPVLAVLLLAGGGLNLLVMSGPSAGAFFGPFAIYAGTWTSLMLTDDRLGGLYRHMAEALAILVVTNCVIAWRIQARALRQAKTATLEAERRRREAEAAIEARAAFVAMISHDLRTPIGAILAGADKIEQGGDGARRYARLVREAGTMMRDLLGDLLDIERMDAGAMPVEQIAFDLRQTLAETLTLWRVKAASNGLRMRCLGARDLPRLVRGDPTRLRQVMNNLLSNAVKFTPAGFVAVRLEFTDSRLRLTVEDSGPGLGAGDAERLFRPFDQIEPGVARRHGGFGLGLAISRKLARLMGGDLTATNRPGGGAAFSFVLPLPPASPAPARRGPLKVLVVDDHAINRETMKILLEPVGVEPVLAENGEAALAALAAEPFDLVLMDINMPVVDGREATRRLRAGGGFNRAIPVIAVSAADTPREQQACVEAGMTSHVAKPIRPQRLYEAMNAALPQECAARAAEPA
jgi:signal transduction histidine kinase/ActR/RegA family two-component response regulator